MKAAIRANSLTLGGSGNKTLHAMEQHGKRLDGTSRSRKVRDMAPLVYGTLDLREAYDRHIEGAKMNSALKRPVMHAVVQFPPELGHSQRNRRIMLDHAVRFVNSRHGGDAVFAARLDQDEEGMATVDVFYAPKYEKVTKRKSEIWISTTRHTKDLCEKHREEIVRRNTKGKFATGPRQCGIALQAELYEYLAAAGLKLKPRKLKNDHFPDRREPEAYKAIRKREADLDARERDLSDREAVLNMREVQLEDVERDIASRIQDGIQIGVEAAGAVITDDLYRTPEGRWQTTPQGPSMDRLRPVWPAILPAVVRIHEWWQRVRGRVDALPDPVAARIELARSPFVDNRENMQLSD